MTAILPQRHLQLIPGRPRVHFTLQGKGGVGKSLVSSLTAQYLRVSEKSLRCIDTDPVNDTLTQVRGLNAEHLNLMRNGRVDERVFDDLIGNILEDPVSFVVDTGATSFVALTKYLEENDAFQLLRDNGREVIVHTVIAGGQACLRIGWIADQRCGPGIRMDFIAIKFFLVLLLAFLFELVGKHGLRAFGAAAQ